MYMNAMIRCLQISLHLPMFNIIFPANVMILFTKIIPVVMYDVLDNPNYNYETFFSFTDITNVDAQI